MLEPQEKKIFDRLKDLDQLFTSWEQRGQDVIDYLAPSRTDIITRRQPGAQKTEKIFDTSPTDALNKCAAGFMGYHTTQSAPWFTLATVNRDLMDLPEVKIYLQEVVRALQLILHQSTFYSQMHEYYVELAGFNTACMWIGDDPLNYLYFKSIPFGQYRIAENYRGLVDVLYRSYQEEARNLETQFGNDALPDEVKRALSDNKYEEKFQVIHAVWPKSDVDIGGVPDVFEFQYAYYLSMGTTAGGDNVLQKGGFFEFPYAVARWSKDSGERYGRGPGIDNMPDIKTLQKQEKSLLKAGQKAVDPPLDVPPGYRTAIRTGPAGLNFRAQGTEGIKAIQNIAGDPRSTIENQQQRRERIGKAFYNDVFMMLQNLQTGRMTIPELMERIGEKLTILGPVIGRLHHEATGPIIERSYGILSRQFPPVLPVLPDVLVDQDLEIVYLSQLSKAQRASEVRTDMDAVNMIFAVAEKIPDIIDNINGDEFAKEIWDLTGVNQKLLNDPRTVQFIRDNRAQMQQIEQQKMDLLLAAEVASKAGGALGQGAPV